MSTLGRRDTPKVYSKLSLADLPVPSDFSAAVNVRIAFADVEFVV